MTCQRGLLSATMLTCAVALSSGGLTGCASPPSTPKTDFIDAYTRTLDKTMIGPDGKRDEVVIAIAYEYFRRHSGDKDIQGSIEEILKNNNISLKEAEDIWNESNAKARAVITQGDAKVIEFLTTDQQTRKQQRLTTLTAQMNAALKTGDIPTARTAAIDLFIENHADKNGHVTFKYSEQTTLPMTFTSRAINPSEMVDFSKIDPKTIHYTGICNLLKPRLLAGLSPAATAGTIKPLSDWICVPFSSPAP